MLGRVAMGLIGEWPAVMVVLCVELPVEDACSMER